MEAQEIVRLCTDLGVGTDNVDFMDSAMCEYLAHMAVASAREEISLGEVSDLGAVVWESPVLRTKPGSPVSAVLYAPVGDSRVRLRIVSRSDNATRRIGTVTASVPAGEVVGAYGIGEDDANSVVRIFAVSASEVSRAPVLGAIEEHIAGVEGEIAVWTAEDQAGPMADIVISSEFEDAVGVRIDSDAVDETADAAEVETGKRSRGVLTALFGKKRRTT